MAGEPTGVNQASSDPIFALVVIWAFDDEDGDSMTRTRQALIATGVVLAGIVVYGLATSPRPTQSEKDRAAVEKVADRFTLEEIADAWAQSKLGDTRPMERIQKAFPFPPRGVREESTAIVLTFEGHNETCIHFRINPPERSSIVFARPC